MKNNKIKLNLIRKNKAIKQISIYQKILSALNGSLNRNILYYRIWIQGSHFINIFFILYL